MARRNPVKPSALDNLIAVFSPKRAAQRLAWRTQYAALGGGYKGARRDRRATYGLNRDEGSADSQILPDLPDLRAASQELVRNFPLATGALNTKVTSVIGSGLRVRSEVDAEYLGLDDDQKESIETELERVFNRWAGSVECDLTRVQTFNEIQDLVYRAEKESGDVLILKRFVERAGSAFGFKLQIVEGGRLVNPGHAADTLEIAGGIRFDSYGAPSAYCIANVSAPSDLFVSAKDIVEVPAFDAAGRANVIHLFQRRRPGQSRGVPDFAPVIEMLKQLGDYTDGELTAAVVSSFLTVFVTSEDGGGLDAMEPASETGAKGSDKDFKLGAGALLDLQPGEKIETVNPGRPNDKFDPFVLAVLRQIGVALELPFEILIKHFTASYSASRAALLEAWKYFRRERTRFAARFCQPVYEEVIAEAVARRFIVLPGFNDPAVREAYLGAVWHGPGMMSLDPLRENKAYEVDENRGWKTAAEITAEKTGNDWDRNIRRRGKEQAKRRELGLTGEVIAERIQSEPKEEAVSESAVAVASEGGDAETEDLA